MPHLNREEPIIEAQDVAKSFRTQAGTVELFRHLSLRILPGESLAIIGRSGAGKSTLLSLLAGLDTPSEGQILFAGKPLAQLDDAARAALRLEQISFIFQSFHLLPELDALDNVRLPLEIQGRRDADAQARRWLEQVGLGERLDHYPAQLSGGEQQRVAIARAFATEPRVLFADEPTGNLDDDTGHQIIEQLFSLNANTGTTLILITHDIDLASRCQRRLHLHNGRLEEVTP
ncbi:ABC transporter ATP-binding protein [Marinobacterium sediminicola]|uniref:ABC transport system ATP-binding protein n=1 Tax=Marinobacterium sediminicola TaxID=518898 RepID=A0ABY1S1P4_9GAMM|nr:ABC transporter ATP-binding protein [Marinobacterium sediminicola]ULG69351.1 ABC transporter ATP-binding protein [Marinobacterium sediminicola]SMR75498.1 putative ABC transport system ATP-binding protein [Marinobacterium sediminicola]